MPLYTPGGTAGALVAANYLSELASGTAANKETARTSIWAAPFDALAFNGMQVNGGIDVSQEIGTTGTTLASGTEKYAADCCSARYSHAAGTAVFTSGQIAATSFPSALPGFSFAHRVKATTALSSPASGDHAIHRYRIEGYRVARLGWGASGAQPLSIGLWLYAMRSATNMIRVVNSAGNRVYHTDIAVVAGWNFITKTIPGDTTGTWDKINGTGIAVDIVTAGKETTPATADTWGTSIKASTTASDGQNQYSSNNDETYVTGLIVLPGLELPPQERMPFIMRPFDQELVECQRHYWKTFNYSTAPVQNSGTVVGAISYIVTASGANYNSVYVPFGVKMRATPTITFFNWGAANNKWRNINLGADSGNPSDQHVGERGFTGVNNPQVAGDLVPHTIAIHAVAKAQL